MSQRQADNEIRVLGEYGWDHYEGRLWRDIPAFMRVAMACVHPGACWRASDEYLEPSRMHGGSVRSSELL